MELYRMVLHMDHIGNIRLILEVWGYVWLWLFIKSYYSTVENSKMQSMEPVTNWSTDVRFNAVYAGGLKGSDSANHKNN